MVKLKKKYDLFVVIVTTDSISTKYKHTFLFQSTAFETLNHGA